MNAERRTQNAEPITQNSLSGKRIVVTRAEEQAGDISARLHALGAIPISCPAIAIVPPHDLAPLDAAIAKLPQYHWLIVTSANGARGLFDRMAALGVPVAALTHLQIGAVGPASAVALAEHGVRASFIPSAAVAEALVAEIGDLRGQGVLLPCADIARETAAAGLRARGATVDVVTAYRTVPGPGVRALADLLLTSTVDAITFTSSSTVRYLLQGLHEAGLSPDAARAQLSQAALVAIGPVTAATARELGLVIAAVARTHTSAGLLDALLELFAAANERDA